MPLTDKQKIDAALTAARTELAQTRHQREAMTIAEHRGELIHKDLITRQAQFILLCLRASVLSFPAKYARRILGLNDEHEGRAVLTKAAHEFLTEIANFDSKAISPDWLAQVEDDGQGEAAGKPPRPSSGQEIRAEQEKAKRRRAQKTQTMRNLRARKG